MTASGPRSAGWHPDPTGADALRYWDGTAWTPHTTVGHGSSPTVDSPEATLRLTARLPEAATEHTTLPLVGRTPGPGPADPARRLALAGTLTAAASLAVACAAFGIALAG